MMVIAHRGANKEAIENTFQSFELAIEAGAQRIEVDLQLTRDGHVVVFHDSDLQRVAGKSLEIAHATRAELELLKLKDGSKIPFLDEMVEAFLSRVEFNLELKGSSLELARKSVEILEKQSAKFEQNCGREWRTRIVFSSFSREPLYMLSEEFIQFPRAFLWGWENLYMLPPYILWRCKTNIIHPPAEFINVFFMACARILNWKVIPWASLEGFENQEEKRVKTWKRMLRNRIFGLCTNYPREFSSWLRENA